jgi:hypothetical protein
MKRVSKVLGAVLAVGIVIMATGSSEAGENTKDGVKVVCGGGTITATAKDSGWHTNPEAPWKYDKGSKVGVDEKAATFKGDKCEGTVTAFICTNDKTQCKGPIKVAVQ